jgi:hypothetical protein
MKINLRKTLIIGIVIAGILVLGIGIYVMFNNKPSSAPVKNDPVTRPNNDINQSIEENINEIQRPTRVNVLSDRSVMGINFNKEGDRVVYYDKETGQVFRISFDAKIWERISDVEVRDLFSVTWALTRDRVIILRKLQNGSVQKYVYDYETGQKHSLDSKMGEIVFSPNGEKILYHYWDQTRESNVAIASYDGSNWESLFVSEMSGLKISWPKNDTVAFVAPGGSFYGASLYFAKLDPPYDPKEVFDDKYDLEVDWSPSGEKLLYNYKREKGDKNINAYIRDFAKETEISINFKATPEDCIWNRNETAIYCVKETKELLSIIPQDYQKKLSLMGDSFWKIDLTNKEISEIYIPEIGEQVYSAGEFLISDNETHIFFVNELDGKLYSLSL